MRWRLWWHWLLFGGELKVKALEAEITKLKHELAMSQLALGTRNSAAIRAMALASDLAKQVRPLEHVYVAAKGFLSGELSHKDLEGAVKAFEEARGRSCPV